MKYAVIDIGSNSVRLMVSQDLITLNKYVITTRLGQNLQHTHLLCPHAIERTLAAIESFVKVSQKENCDKLLVFATEAVRSANNKNEFCNLLKERNISLDIVPSTLEAKLGFWGAHHSGVSCIVDIGGASTELCVGDDNQIYYAKSLPIGLVRIKDACQENMPLIKKLVDDTIVGYGTLPHFDNLLGIGGTATSFGAIVKKLEVYDPNVVNNSIITQQQILDTTMHISQLSMEERKNVLGLAPKRRDVIVGGGILLSTIMQYLNVTQLTVKENDNMEGYLKYHLGLVK